MKIKRNIAGLAFLTITAASLSLLSSAAYAQDGHLLFRRKCVMCHGHNGRGQPWLIKKVGLARANLVEAARGKTDEELRSIIRDGAGEMKGVSMKEDEARAVVNFIRQLY